MDRGSYAVELLIFFSVWYRCVTALAERIASTSALEDKRLRRDLHVSATVK